MSEYLAFSHLAIKDSLLRIQVIRLHTKANAQWIDQIGEVDLWRIVPLIVSNPYRASPLTGKSDGIKEEDMQIALKFFELPTECPMRDQVNVLTLLTTEVL